MSRDKKPERVFVSYSHDNAEHLAKALDLANRLREDGVDAILDQYEEAPEEGWPRWMDAQVHHADYVLVVGSENYFNRLLGIEDAGAGLGAKWEGAILYQHLYEADTKTKAFIPIIFDENHAKFIPTPLRGLTRYLVTGEAGYDKLYRRITNQPKIEKPRLGQRRELPIPKGGLDSKMYVFGPIDVDLWNQANWTGTFFITDEANDGTMEPAIGLGFKDEKFARLIFNGLIEQYGSNDEIEELRVSIIEGDVAGEGSGYTVHIGCDWEKTYKKLSGRKSLREGDLSLAVSRLNRMVPLDGTNENLDRFKKAYMKAKTYRLIPGLLDETRTVVTPFPELNIRKSQIYFRHVEEIGKNDPDAIALKSGDVIRGLV